MNSRSFDTQAVNIENYKWSYMVWMYRKSYFLFNLYDLFCLPLQNPSLHLFVCVVLIKISFMSVWHFNSPFNSRHLVSFFFFFFSFVGSMQEKCRWDTNSRFFSASLYNLQPMLYNNVGKALRKKKIIENLQFSLKKLSNGT